MLHVTLSAVGDSDTCGPCDLNQQLLGTHGLKSKTHVRHQHWVIAGQKQLVGVPWQCPIMACLCVTVEIVVDVIVAAV